MSSFGQLAKHERLKLSWETCRWPLLFLLSLSLTGLLFLPGLLFVAIILINRFLKDRYDFLIMCTIFVGGYSFHTPGEAFLVHTYYYVTPLAIGGILILRKPTLLKKIILLWIAYAVSLFIIGCFSEESWAVQIRPYLSYISFVYFIIPLLVFSGRDFDINVFYAKVMPYVFITAIFYIIDGFIFCGYVLMPRTHTFSDTISTIWNLQWHPFSFSFIRKYPPGLYLVFLIIVPLVNKFKLTPLQWAILLLGLISTRTFTFISGCVIVYLFLKLSHKNLIKWSLISILLFPALYWVDSILPHRTIDKTYQESFLRIKSSIDQVLSISNIEDEEDLSKLGSMRMAQAIPKFELLYELDKEWTGLGFLDKYHTTNPKFIIYNEFYDPEFYDADSWEVATGIEITALDVILTIGYIGFIIHLAFFIIAYLLIRKLDNSIYFLSILLGFAWLGIGGFEGWITTPSLYLMGLSYGIVLLSNKRRLNMALPHHNIVDTHTTGNAGLG